MNGKIPGWAVTARGTRLSSEQLMQSIVRGSTRWDLTVGIPPPSTEGIVCRKRRPYQSTSDCRRSRARRRSTLILASFDAERKAEPKITHNGNLIYDRLSRRFSFFSSSNINNALRSRIRPGKHSGREEMERFSEHD